VFRAAIFDLDGLLIDSEPLWKSAERAAFAGVGIEITEQMSAVTAPMTTRQVAEHWYRVRPWQGPRIEDLEAAVIARVGESLRECCPALPGAQEIPALCGGLGWRVALASNSPAVLCQLALNALGIDSWFDAVVSADFVPRGKPDPAVYLLAAQRLGVAPGECLAFEDSATGVRAARAAGMRVVAVPQSEQVFAEDALPHLSLGALHEFSREHARELWARGA